MKYFRIFDKHYNDFIVVCSDTILTIESDDYIIEEVNKEIYDFYLKQGLTPSTI